MRGLILMVLLLMTGVVQGAGPAVTFTPEGVQLGAGTMGNFILAYPYIELHKASGSVRGVAAIRSPDLVEVTYPGTPVVLTFTRTDDVVKVHAEHVENLNYMKCVMLIPFNFAGRGVWSAPATGTTSVLPLKFDPAMTFLYGKNIDSFRLGDGEGREFTLSFDPAPFLQLQDSRKWNWKIFELMALYKPYEPKATYDFTIKYNFSGSEKVKPRVDEFGQPTALDFPGKIKTVEELRADVELERAYYAGLQPPRLARYGGMPGSGEQYQVKGSGFFRVAEAADRKLLVTPDGDLFFQLGVCTVSPCDDYTYITGRREIYSWLPAYEGEFKTAFRADDPRNDFSFYVANLIRKYGKPYDYNAWKQRMAERLLAWGFNSQGAFAGATDANRRLNFAWTPGLPLHGLKKLTEDFFDPFDAATLAQLEDAMQKQVKPQADNPLIIGYFIANEQHYSDLLRLLPQVKGQAAAKLKLVEWLRNKYPDIAAFNRSWKCQASGFEALADMALQVTTPDAWQDMDQFTKVFIDRYFEVVNAAFRRADSHHMLLGARFLPGQIGTESAVKACGKYCEVFSINYYSMAIDKDFLDRVHQLSGRPVLLSEWSFGTAEQGLAGGVIDVRDQTERGLAYRNYVEQAAALPYVVGSQWFSCIDQALTGRFFQHYNGECMNIGLVNVADRPFKPFLAEAMKTNYRIYDVVMGKTPPFAWQPNGKGQSATHAARRMQAPRALPGHKVDGIMTPWPGRPSERLAAANLVNGKDSGKMGADFWLCWDERNLYLFIAVDDPTPCCNKFDHKYLWKGDAVELFFGPKELKRTGGLLFDDRQLVIAAKPDGMFDWYNSTENYPIERVVVPNPKGNGYVIEAGIPWKALGIVPKAGLELRFDLGLDDNDANNSKPQRQFMWSGTANNANERTYWGTVVLTE